MRAAILATLCLTSSVAAQSVRPPVVGRWDLAAIDGNRSLPSWVEIEWSGNRTLVGRMVVVVGSARPVSRFEFTDNTLRWSLPPQWESGANDLQFVATYAGDSLVGSMTTADGRKLSWSGHRAPSLQRSGTPQWGAPMRIFNDRDLSGWHVVGGESQWKVVNGVLTNARSGGNLVTDRAFNDFKLHVEFRIPRDGNSGIYLRGRYEVQVEDTVGHPRATTSLGGVYGFLLPNQDAGLGAGEWQSYDITLVGRRVSVVLNGKQVLCDQEIPGHTGGALDSAEEKPGPLMLQGDHTAIEYRNIVLTSAR